MQAASSFYSFFNRIILLLVVLYIVHKIYDRYKEKLIQRKYLGDEIGRKEKIKTSYRYYHRDSVMTTREKDFYRRLDAIFGSKYIVAPQVHLSALVTHRVRGQNWEAAFRHINGKSVDYVLISKQNLNTVCAIELDDRTHEAYERSLRDVEVERILEDAKIPLVRIDKPSEYSDKNLVEMIAHSVRSTAQSKAPLAPPR